MEYLIRSLVEKDDDGRELYWSNDDGWVDKTSATVFTGLEHEEFRFNIPKRAVWVPTKAPFSRSPVD